MVIDNKTPATFIKGIPLWNIQQYCSSASILLYSHPDDRN